VTAGQRRRRGDGGTALVELTWLAILLLLPMVWIVVSGSHVQRGAFAVSGAARAAGRAYALAPTDAAGRVRARAAARQVLVDHGIADAPLSVRVRCSPYPSDCHSGTSIVTVRIDSAVALPLLPDVLGGGSPSFALHATHTVPIGRYEEVGRAAP
jgi:Flp pilus assembly protein TadG